MSNKFKSFISFSSGSRRKTEDDPESGSGKEYERFRPGSFLTIGEVGICIELKLKRALISENFGK